MEYTTQTINKKAIALISGGLDSILAAKIIMEQGIETLGVAFVMQFASRDEELFKEQVKKTAFEAGIPIRLENISSEFLDIVKNPEYGYGANLNPCIDCRILMLRLAKKIMEEEKAGFIVTGEVLGERPMSQHRKALELVEEKSFLNGYLVRPLSAKLLPKTIPEEKGIIDREKFFDIHGRSRKGQIKLAEKYGLCTFSQPAGGCLLTDSIFSRKLKDLINSGSLNSDDIALLKYGRHFRIDEKTKVIVGRNHDENEEIKKLKKPEDIIIRLKVTAGPYALLRGITTFSNIKKSAGLLISYSKKKNQKNVEVEIWPDGSGKVFPQEALPLEEIEKLRI